MGFEAVVFDLDDTLIVEADTARASMERAAAIVDKTDAAVVADLLFESAREIWRSGPYLRLCLELGIASWEGLWSTFEGNHAALDGVRDWAPEYRQAARREGLHRHGIDDDPTLALHMSTTFIEAQRSAHRPIRDAAPLVRALARQSRLGLLTNGPSDIQRHKLARSGLADCFDTVVISGELGIGKPDVRAFSHVMERLATRAEDTLMIGDSWERDVCGALEAGMTAIWIAGGKTPPEEGREVIVVDRIDQLPENLERLRSSR